jgi:hypothetical protein
MIQRGFQRQSKALNLYLGFFKEGGVEAKSVNVYLVACGRFDNEDARLTNRLLSSFLLPITDALSFPFETLTRSQQK